MASMKARLSYASFLFLTVFISSWGTGFAQNLQIVPLIPPSVSSMPGYQGTTPQITPQMPMGVPQQVYPQPRMPLTGTTPYNATIPTTPQPRTSFPSQQQFQMPGSSYQQYRSPVGQGTVFPGQPPFLPGPESTPVKNLNRTYTGKPISLNVLEQDLKVVLNTLAGMTGTNIVVDPEVTGTVTLMVDQVPWDQVLDMILSMNNLGKEQVGNIIRISSQAKLTIPFDIKQFGYDLFQEVPSMVTSVESVAVNPNYVVGPNDVVRVTVWGNVEGAWDVEIDRDGNISLPRLGMLGVAGLRYQDLKNVLKTEFAKYYTDFEMNVSLGQLKSIRVFVVGHVTKPGAYLVSGTSTMMDALFAAGGPSRTGTLRDVQLKRAGQTIAHFDLYDFLLKGSKMKDERLMSEDVIFVPSIGKIAGVTGYVKRPAIYEMKGPTRIMDLLEMAGGLTGHAFKGRFQILRTENFELRTNIEGDLNGVHNDSDQNILLQDEDLLQIFPVTEDKNVVVLQGAVHFPGEFGISAGKTTVKDIVSRAGGLQYFASDTAELTRVRVTPKGPHTEVMTIDIRKALLGDPKSNLVLERNDNLIVRQVPEWDLYKQVSVQGEVKFPGTYTIKKGERLSSLIERAGGFTSRAYQRGAVFTRVNTRELQQRQINEMVSRLEREMLSASSASISAAVSSDDAKLVAAENAQRMKFISNLREVQAQGRMVIKLEDPRTLRNSPYDIELEDGDNLVIPSDPHTVQVIGAVYNQTSFIYEPNKDVAHYINVAGGYTSNADKGKVYVLKTDGTALRPKGGLSWDSASNKWVSGSSGFLESGDTIVVPDQLERLAWMRPTKDITTILAQIATTAGIAFRLVF